MTRGRKAGKRTNKTVGLSIPKRLYYIPYGIAGNNEQKLNKPIKYNYRGETGELHSRRDCLYTGLKDRIKE